MSAKRGDLSMNSKLAKLLRRKAEYKSSKSITTYEYVEHQQSRKMQNIQLFVKPGTPRSNYKKLKQQHKGAI
jgi:hypothetical protein